MDLAVWRWTGATDLIHLWDGAGSKDCYKDTTDLTVVSTHWIGIRVLVCWRELSKEEGEPRVREDAGLLDSLPRDSETWNRTGI